MAKIQQKECAQKLRTTGISIKDIARIVKVSQSTVSYWCRDIVLSPMQIKHLQEKSLTAGVRALMLASEQKRKSRIHETKRLNLLGSHDIKSMNKRDLFMLGLGLYWGEGYQEKTEGIGFTNSNPHIICIIIRWFKEIYGIKNADLTLRVSINAVHKARNEKLLSYWSQITSIPYHQFTKTSFIESKSKKIYENHNEYYGTLRVKIRCGTNLKRRIIGSLQRLSI